MNSRIAYLFTLVAVGVAFCVPSRADSDGSFCTAKGYLVYEVREGITPGVTGHVLRVVRFEPQRGIYAAGEVTLQNFQVHHMVCSQDRVEISGWGNIFKKYTIDIAGPEKPKVVDFAEDPTRRFDPAKDGPDPPQFDYAQAGPVALESLDPDHQYTLWLSASEKNVEGGVEHYRKAELTQADAQGTVSQRLVLYENRFLETID